MKEIPSDSVEYLRVPVAALDDAGAAEDVTAATVTIGFSTDDDTEPATFHPATWETSETLRLKVGATSQNTQYKARILVGPGTTVGELSGIQHVWVKITDSPETPIVYAGAVKFI